MTSLAGATFPDNHPSLARVVDVLIDLETRARMWCESSMLSRHLAFSRLGISKACKYRDNFQQLFALLDRALQELMSTVKVESNCNLSELQAQLSQEFSAAAAAAGERAASQTEALQKLGGQSASLDALLAKSRTQAIALAELETRLDSILESLKTDLAAGAQVVLVAAKAAAAVAEAMEQHESSGGGGRRGAEDNTDEIVAALTANILNLVVPELLEKLEADGKLTSEAVKSAKEAVLGEVHGVESTERAARERLNRFEALSQCRGVDMASVYRYEPYNFDDPDDQEKASLGEGQFGETFRMLNMNDMVVYAVKLVNLKKAKLEEAQVKKESKVLGQLYHPNIVRYYGCFYYGKKNKFWAIAMEYLSGGSLLAKMKSSPKPTPKQRLRWVLEIASALAHMHEHNVQHRDLKPDNVLFASEAPNARVVVIDLGLACLNLAKSKASKAVGAEMYRSPEKALGERYGPADDVWVLGLIAACLALGQPLEDWIEESGGSGGLFALNRSKVNKFVAEAVALCPSLGALAAALLIQDASLRPTAASVAESKGDAAALVRPSVSPDAITEEQEENEDDGKVAIDRKWKLEAEARVREAEARAREAEARAKAAEAEARALAAEAEVQRLREVPKHACLLDSLYSSYFFYFSGSGCIGEARRKRESEARRRGEGEARSR
jgi:NIMA (never in mitosis gene a)-related kinase